MTTTTMMPQPASFSPSSTPQNPPANIFNSTNFAPPPAPVAAVAARLQTRQEPGQPGRRLVVGPDIALQGEISTCDILVVEGTVQASLKDCKQVEIAPGGLFKGNAEIDNAIIAGIYEGNLTVRGRIHIMAGGQILGSLRYGSLQVDAGGEINGDVQSLAAAAQPRQAPAQAAAQPRPAGRSGGAYNNLYGSNPAAAGSF